MTEPEPVKDAPHVATVLRLAGVMQRNAFVLTAIVGVLAIVVAAVLRAWPGAIGAVVGVVIGGGAGYVGTFVMSRTARASAAGVMVAAMTAFAGKVLVLLVFLILFRGTTLFDNQAFAFTLLAVTAAYIVGEVIGFVRARIPVVDL
ncbi:hypothetical protein WEH80_29725 [Actinomycetes bacterium KLBMP 9759]